jgi:hypothetical protein
MNDEAEKLMNEDASQWSLDDVTKHTLALDDMTDRTGQAVTTSYIQP